MGKSVVTEAKKVVRKTTGQKPKLRALRDGSHGIDGGVYTFKEGDVLTLSKVSHYDSMKDLDCFEDA